jgi:hypothetical protein
MSCRPVFRKHEISKAVKSWGSRQLASFDWEKSGRGDRIRTYDLLVPNQALYQAKLHPDARRTARAFNERVKPAPRYCAHLQVS